MAQTFNSPIQTYTSQGTIAPYSFVKAGTGNFTAAQATAATDDFLGLSDDLGNLPILRVDVAVIPCFWKVKLGGTVARGAKLTSNAAGLGVTAAAGNNYAAIAETDGVAGDIIDCRIMFGKA
jgi:hypothetical protein